MDEIINTFFTSYFNFSRLRSVYGEEKTPKNMMATPVDEEGWYTWKPIEGTLTNSNYRQVEEKFGVKFPKSFVEWHKQYFFLDCSCQLMGLPVSSPTEPLQQIIDNLDYSLAKDLIEAKLYPFGDEGNDAGPLVFDGRYEVKDNEYSIRVYDHEYGGDMDGLSEIVFSSFPKLLECFTHYIQEVETRKNFEIIPDFFQIDPTGAGKTGKGYWLSWVAMEKENDELFGD
ncbi:SMI1/KNR4 family protein [Pedobacter borealis]|uniref:SMI1/KNR4 family protein n=1 Tax=Pedobacter borealis TaxID=475254 RepID=UPI000493217F|nr:SMI1/KNR4 family protein [Pedobacter borealis]